MSKLHFEKKKNEENIAFKVKLNPMQPRRIPTNPKLQGTEPTVGHVNNMYTHET